MTASERVSSGELLTLRVTDIRDEAEGIRSFELRALEGGSLPAFEPGAHLPVLVELADGRSAQRHYSLLGDSQDRSRFRIAVRLEAASRGGSRFLHERLRPGSTLSVAAPVNGFPLRLEAEHSILIAGGIGITAILSMVRTLRRLGHSFEVHYAARTPATMAFRAELETLAGWRSHLYFTRAAPPLPIDLASILVAPGSGTHVYACGPSSLLRAVTAVGTAAGWPKERIHSESFGPQRDAGDRPIAVYLERSEVTVQVLPGESVLEALLEAGAWVPYECRRGTCGTCMTRVVAGVPDHRDSCLSPELRTEYMCPCVSRAQSDGLVLDL